MERWDALINVLRDRPHATGAEIGVLRGDTSRALLGQLPALKLLICVDAWEYYSDYESDSRDGAPDGWPNQDALDDARKTFEARMRLYPDRVHVLAMESEMAARKIEDESLDFVFIDANHSYDYVQQDIATWKKKVHRGGVIAGHDYGYCDTWGVDRAVDEAFGRERVHLAGGYVWWVERQ